MKARLEAMESEQRVKDPQVSFQHSAPFFMRFNESANRSCVMILEGYLHFESKPLITPMCCSTARNKQAVLSDASHAQRQPRSHLLSVNMLSCLTDAAEGPTQAEVPAMLT